MHAGKALVHEALPARLHEQHAAYEDGEGDGIEDEDTRGEA